MHKSRWGFHPCALEQFRLLRQLWRVALQRRKMVAAWRRWAAKLPHNRVKYERLRDDAGRVVGYGPPVAVLEPPLPSVACRKITRPSGLVEVEFAGPSGGDLRRLQEAYRLARRPVADPSEVEKLPVTADEVRGWLAAVGAA